MSYWFSIQQKNESKKLQTNLNPTSGRPLAPANQAKPAMHIRHPAGNELPPEGEGACHL